MKLAIMQPYFFPYLGYISLIKHVDEFILFDVVQFRRHGWIERNRILKPNKGWQYVSVPLKKHSLTTVINEIEINNDQDWKNKIFRQLEHYKKKAPYYAQTIEVINKALKIETESIVKLNQSIINEIIHYLGFSKDILIFSEMDLKIDTPKAPDEWALNICKAYGDVKEYWNPESGREFFDSSKYTAANIDLKFIKMNLEPYSQKRKDFEAGLSIIDVMMFNSPDEINLMLDKY